MRCLLRARQEACAVGVEMRGERLPQTNMSFTETRRLIESQQRVTASRQFLRDGA